MPSNPKNTRRCIVCREHDDKSNLLRFVKIDGIVQQDESQKLEGRGVWVHSSGECIKKLVKKRILDFAFKTKVGENVYGKLDEQ